MLLLQNNLYLSLHSAHFTQFATCFICLLLPLFALALPAADKSAKDKSDHSISPVYAVSANEVLPEITVEDTTRSKRSGSGGFDIFSALKNVSILVFACGYTFTF